MNVLIATERDRLGEQIQKALRRAGVLVVFASTGKLLMQKAAAHEYEGVLLDHELAGGAGLKWLHYLREQQPHAAVIIMGSDADSEVRVQYLLGGADDFVRIPFPMEELVARFKVIWRRPILEMASELVCGPIRADLYARCIYFENQRLELTGKEFELFTYLLRYPQRVISKDRLVDLIWGDDVDGAFSYDFLYAHIKNLRHKLSTIGLREVVKTVYGLGYQIDLEGI
jgi:DNA-binding response OmpR family regulator